MMAKSVSSLEDVIEKERDSVFIKTNKKCSRDYFDEMVKKYSGGYPGNSVSVRFGDGVLMCAGNKTIKPGSKIIVHRIINLGPNPDKKAYRNLEKYLKSKEYRDYQSYLSRKGNCFP
jgi:hypothetical protein